MPVPGDVSAAFYSLAEALNIMRREGGGGDAGATGPAGDIGSFPTLNPDGTPIRVHGDDLLAQMIQTLLRDAETPPKEVEGVNEEFCDSISTLHCFLLASNTGEDMELTIMTNRARPCPALLAEARTGVSDLQQSVFRRQVPTRCAVTVPPDAFV